jgi:transposase-like protein
MDRMRWSGTPVEQRGNFRPPFCPNPRCPEHHRTSPGFRWLRWGSFSTRRRSSIPRFRCRRCGRTFSRQTFSVSYYLKRPELIRPVAAGLVAGSAHRQMARSVSCAPSTVSRLLARLGRHAMLLQARALGELRGRLAEAVVLDHFETFEYTQDYPFGIATAVGAVSWFLYGLDPAPHGRSGRLSEPQRRRLRGRPGRSRWGGYLGSTRRVLDSLLDPGRPAGSLRILGDGHRAYDRAVRGHPEASRIRLERYPNPRRCAKGSARSPEGGVRDAAMFPADLLHKIFRHSLAHHRRETIAFGRRLNAVMERMALTAVWRNFVKRRTERWSGSGTPAMAVGLTGRRWGWKRVFARRLFFDREEVVEPWGVLYRREWRTPLLASNTRHALRRAF